MVSSPWTLPFQECYCGIYDITGLTVVGKSGEPLVLSISVSNLVPQQLALFRYHSLHSAIPESLQASHQHLSKQHHQPSLMQTSCPSRAPYTKCSGDHVHHPVCFKMAWCSVGHQSQGPRICWEGAEWRCSWTIWGDLEAWWELTLGSSTADISIQCHKLSLITNSTGYQLCTHQQVISSN